MNRLFAILLMALSVVVTVRAQSSEEQYVRIYNTIQQADGLNTAGKPQEALTKYLEAQTSLQRMQKLSPDWNPKVVAFRLNYLAEKISGISASAPAPVKPTVVAPAPTPGA